MLHENILLIMCVSVCVCMCWWHWWYYRIPVSFFTCPFNILYLSLFGSTSYTVVFREEWKWWNDQICLMVSSFASFRAINHHSHTKKIRIFTNRLYPPRMMNELNLLWSIKFFIVHLNGFKFIFLSSAYSFNINTLNQFITYYCCPTVSPKF